MKETILQTLLTELKSGNWIVWASLLLVLVVAIKLLIRLSKSIVVTLIIIGILFGLSQAFPDFSKLVVHYVLEWIPDPSSQESEGASDSE